MDTVTIEYNVFNGNETREGAFSVARAIAASMSTNDIRGIIAEREGMNLNGLVVDRNENKVVIRAEAIYG